MAEDRGTTADDLACKELVDGLTEYLDGGMDDPKRKAMERHLRECEGCGVALDQFQSVIRVVGRLTPADIERVDAQTRDRLLATLRVMRRR